MKKKKQVVDAVSPDPEWEHENNLNTVLKAHEIMMDKEKMKHVHRLAGRKHKAIKSLKDVHNSLNEKFGSEAKDEE